ncbi:unnamed protein product [Adineta steineri]|uniref:Uncharacterized protein n=1 Tax=Adineta steineri TaxID=433720 RepID=A0A819D6N6_9BILA|nr:unnamed protein product [Adineta steineri]CAF3818686.1 unnamed protein product [Adineta steineri]
MVNFKLLIITAAIGLISIIFGIIGLATPKWIDVEVVAGGSNTIYGLFRQCTVDATGTKCTNVPTFKTAQGLQIAGVVIIAIGVISFTILNLLSRNSYLHLISPVLPIIGSILILIGFLLFPKYVIELYSTNLMKLQVNIGYSMVLMVIACIGGFLTAIYFAFSAGYSYCYNHSSFELS